MHSPLEYTGERMVPEAADVDIFWEHVYRYRFAAKFAKGMRVLDVACGEGYGSCALAKAGAASVVGVDISEEAVKHAKNKYGVDARVGDASRLPIDDSSIDLLVSFETIEHVPNPDRFLDECRRVIATQGIAVISTPNKQAYSENYDNPFHCSEMTRNEFHARLNSRFKDIRMMTQCPFFAPWWSLRWGAAITSSAFEIRGMGRLRNMLRTLLCPETKQVPSMEKREFMSSIILASDRPGASMVNRYALRPEPSFEGERPRYLIAVARPL